MTGSDGTNGGTRGAWLARIVVLTACAGVLIGFGPRAWAVLRTHTASAAEHGGPAVVLDRVGFAERPAWLAPPLLTQIAQDLQPLLHGDVAILDEPTALALATAVQQVPWVAEARIEREFPDRFRLHVALRRPVLAVRDENGGPLCLCDKNGIVLPWVDGLDVPQTFLRRGGGPPTMRATLGHLAPDDRVPAAAAVAVQWRDELAPLVPGCPKLLEVDTTNLGERYLRREDHPEVRVVVARHDGAPVVFGYGRPVGDPRACVPVAVKAKVLAAVLAEFPGLQGLCAGDLRFAVRWRSWLRPRQGT